MDDIYYDSMKGIGQFELGTKAESIAEAMQRCAKKQFPGKMNIDKK